MMERGERREEEGEGRDEREEEKGEKRQETEKRGGEWREEGERSLSELTCVFKLYKVRDSSEGKLIVTKRVKR